MAQRLTDRTELLTINDAQTYWIHVVDVSDTTDDPTGTSKKITRANFLSGLSSDASTLDGQNGAYYLNRSNHTGTQAISTVSGLQTALDLRQPLDADLTAIADLSGTSGLLRKTAANTWTLDTASYLTTTGNGSGLTNVNATTLDGIDSSQFLRSDTADTMTGALTISGVTSNSLSVIQANANTAIFADNTSTGRAFIFRGAGSIIGELRTPDNTPQHQWFGNGNYTATGLVTCSQINTGQGATEVYLMNQNIRTNDSPSFTSLSVTNAVTAGSFVTSNWTIDQNGTTLEFRYNGVTQMSLTSNGILTVQNYGQEA